MKRYTARCGCSLVIKITEHDDGLPGVEEIHVPAICDECLSNDCVYTKSPHWRDRPLGQRYVNPDVEEVPKKDKRHKKRRSS